MSDVKLMAIKEIQDEGPACQRMTNYCMMLVLIGRSGNSSLLFIELLLKSLRIVVPSTMRPPVLYIKGHQGIVNCKVACSQLLSLC